LQKGGFFVGSDWSAGIDLVKEHWDFLISGGVSPGDSVPFGLSPTAEAFRKAVEPLPPIVAEVLGDGKRRVLGTIVSADGYILTKASELYGSISCRLADGRTLPAVTVGISRQHDLALLKIDAAGLPQIRWRRERLPVGSFLGAMRYRETPVVSVMALAMHSVPPAPGYLVGGKVKEVKDGVEVEELWLRRTSLRKGDVIVHVEGRPTPNLKAFEQVTERHSSGRAWSLPSVIPGDPIRVGLKRDGKDQELRFPLPAMVQISGYDSASPRSCAFPAVFDTDAIVTRDTCGGPLVDRSGEVAGITIALATKERVYVVPAAVARKVFNQLKQP
jgi:serine protease Do